MAIGLEPALMPNDGLSNTPERRTFQLQILFGTTSITSAIGKNLKVHRSATGTVQVTFPKTYRRITAFRWGWLKKPASEAVLFPCILDNAAIASANADGTSTVTFDMRSETGTATDATSGDVLALEFDVTNDLLIDATTFAAAVI